MKDTVVVYSYEYFDHSSGRWFVSEVKKTALAIEQIKKSKILIETGQRVHKSQIDVEGNYAT